MKSHFSSGNALQIESGSPNDTYKIGMTLGGLAFPGLLVLLKGPLGAGKTRFTQGYGAALGFNRVKSPSFIIMNEYEGRLPLLHVDLYRLEEGAEAETLGIEDYLEDGFTAVVEWAERWNGLEAPELIEIDISKNAGETDARTFTMKARGRLAENALKDLNKTLGPGPESDKKKENDKC